MGTQPEETLVIVSLRSCPRCERSEPEIRFWTDKGRSTGRQHVCVECLQEERERFKADPVDAREERCGMTLKEVAEVMNLSPERVRQIEQTAIRKLRNNARTMAVVRRLLEGRS